MNLKSTDKEVIAKRNCHVKGCREKATGIVETLPLCSKHHNKYREFRKYAMLKGKSIDEILKEIDKSEKDYWHQVRCYPKNSP